MPNCEDLGNALDDCLGKDVEACGEAEKCHNEWEKDFEECADDCIPDPFNWECAECTLVMALDGSDCIELDAICDDALNDCLDEALDYWLCLENHPYASGGVA